MQEISHVLPAEFTLISSDQIASLWSNYGHIYRLHLSTEPKSLILKIIHPPSISDPSESHLRKLLSYDVERWFYRHLSSRLPASIKVADSYPTAADPSRNLILEDLSLEYPFSSGGSLGKDATRCVLSWLAGFHAAFFRYAQDDTIRPVPCPRDWKRAEKVDGVWKRGTYYYLETRRDEMDGVDQEDYQWLLPWIEKVNAAIDQEIISYGTLVHGDVKGANIIFNSPPNPHRMRKAKTQQTPGDAPRLRCALYDLQYVGLGLLTLDLVYFIGTSVESSLLSDASEKVLLEYYFAEFTASLPSHAAGCVEYPFEVFWAHWELAIVDWYRFMAGWGFWGNDSWVERRARTIVTAWASDLSSWRF